MLACHQLTNDSLQTYRGKIRKTSQIEQKELEERKDNTIN
jgi:hypothetical protein